MEDMEDKTYFILLLTMLKNKIFTLADCSMSNVTMENVLDIISNTSISINDYQWLSMINNDYKWLTMIINDYQWLSMIINDYQWLSMIINNYQWLSMIIND